MLVNKYIAVSTSSVLLVPYEASHVPAYHEWLKDEEIQETTASEPLSLEEEYAMQASWRSDHDKLTFIACIPSSAASIKAGGCDTPDRMIGDVNLFLSPADEDEEGCIGELELMIAPKDARRQGYGRGTILTFLQFIQLHLDEIMNEYKTKLGIEKMKLLQLKVKIGSKNEKSIKLFEGIGFIKVEASPNYFGEFELTLEGFLSEERTRNLMERYNIQDYKEMEYQASIV
ncbi:N-acetyltransferase [Mollisia scopiformis]|uniref:N-acetyltransferase n=1 Tax=Mollisia scopiformis TaxID=149040 RepID=A0A194X5R8_MOLSC|nr:N-acetyltransferase [Mollisia scopiformis]KUJ15521.1 N-acetyltransferase [Mollisia scopiformis]